MPANGRIIGWSTCGESTHELLMQKFVMKNGSAMETKMRSGPNGVLLRLIEMEPGYSGCTSGGLYS